MDSVTEIFKVIWGVILRSGFSLLAPDEVNPVIASFNDRQPIARAGWSINIYRLENDEQLNSE